MMSNEVSETTNGSSNWTRIVLAVLGLVIIVNLTILILRQSQSAPPAPTGSATILGQVVNPAGTPVFDAFIYIEGMVEYARTRDDGSFVIEEVPAGNVELVIGVTPDPPQFYPLQISEGEVLSLGRVEYVSP
jgi:hypothetical protein